MDTNDFRSLMARVPAPVTVVTASLDGKPVGATVSSFASLSLDPPLISIALMAQSGLADVIAGSASFAVNLLGHCQEAIAMAFASRAEDRFSDVSWVWENGLPRIIGAASFMVCALHQEVQGGDHRLMFGRVLSSHLTDEPPLVYTARAFGTHSKLISDRMPTVRDAIRACAI